MATKKSGLIFIIVLLALAPFGQADFQIGTRYLDGTAFEPDTDILRLDENLYLSMYAEEVFPTGSAVVRWQLLCDRSLATITGGVLGPDAYDGIIYAHPGGRGRQGWFDYDPWLGPGYEPGVYADNILYTPQSLGDVTVEFWSNGGMIGAPDYYLADSVVIRQVPEPMTIALLGLGGVFLLRRRTYSK
ncbi:MAG: PEP-CTERM sorting domain-containing protein [Planctomycetes bacterium]|nr:PEP-CTERM sorting domain-containing protein [Planctomycetota bacterium]